MSFVGLLTSGLSWGAVGRETLLSPVSERPAMSASASSPTHSNRLAREKSPYLLQHQHNPVDWYAWGEDAFAKAVRENKPIFLSIGYSTCHWCHVMERESFEDEKTAAILNEHYVCIKVDREERPDVDKIYMTFVQAMTGSGGWPLNVFLTPDRKPFMGGTYWPPERKYGRASFQDVLQQVHQAWVKQQDKVVESSKSLHSQLGEIVARQPTNHTVVWTAADLQQAGVVLKEGYDRTHGGFGRAPKFPTPSHPLFLLRYGTRFHDDAAVKMVLHTCERMAAGGICDQLGGGFARYSVDEKWLVPHFEKMLYDNAQLVQLYLDAYLVSGDEHMADVVRDILKYVLRDMTHKDGGFFSAEDADSEGKEGKFYCWTRAEVKSALTAQEFAVASRVFGITEHGNFVDHSDPDPLPNQNVLSWVEKPRNAEERSLLASAKEKLFKIRSQRVRPHLDDKVLASWNGLMLGAMARASAVLGEKSYREAALRNLEFLQKRLWDPASKTLFHRWRDGERDQVQLQESYAFVLSGVLDVYETTADPTHLQFAIDLAEGLIQRFFDAQEGGFWQSPLNSQDLILRVKEDYDGAEPSGNSVAALSLLKLAAITDRKDFREAAEKTLRWAAPRWKQLPQSTAFLLRALDFALEEPKRVVLAMEGTQEVPPSMFHTVHGVYQPNKVVLGTRGPVEPFARTLSASGGSCTAYVCSGTACQPPTQDLETLRRHLK